MRHNKIFVEVISDNAIDYDSNILVLKYAQILYGLDRSVVVIFEEEGINIHEELPKTGKYLIKKTPNKITPPNVIFIGTQRLKYFGYKEIREFGRIAISSLYKSQLSIEHGDWRSNNSVNE
ncbi:hypothetical protein MHK_008925 [Candidatus Magnetomorum sp. HK-1]|nr:hypothetical protein MHK_008925 [Candidatus Magnetomorum sp. HK-1]